MYFSDGGRLVPMRAVVPRSNAIAPSTNATNTHGAGNQRYESRCQLTPPSKVCAAAGAETPRSPAEVVQIQPRSGDAKATNLMAAANGTLNRVMVRGGPAGSVEILNMLPTGPPTQIVGFSPGAGPLISAPNVAEDISNDGFSVC